MNKMLIWCVAALFVVSGKAKAQEMATPKTYVFKKVDGIELKADVYLSLDAPKQSPVVVYIHGGALIFGDRHGQPRPELLEKLLDAGYVVVSVDYRLAPRTKAKGIAEDVEDACKWVRKEGPQLFNIDPDRFVVMGGSAGGYLTLLLGGRLTPPPQAIVSFSGYGDLLWYNKARIKQVPKKIPTYEGEGGPDFYGYTRRYGTWIKEVTGLDPDEDSVELKRLRPVENITKRYPATLMLHSKSDGDVPFEVAVKMKQALDSHGVSNELFVVPSGHAAGMIRQHPEVVTTTMRFLDRISDGIAR